MSVAEWFFTDPQTNPKKRFNYEANQTSRYVYFLGGRLRTVRPNSLSDIGRVAFPIGVMVAIVLPLVLFLVFEAKWCWHHISPAVVILFVYGWLHCLTGFLRACLMDPGVLPRNVHLTDSPEVTGLPAEYNATVTLPGHSGTNVIVKYCPTCRIWRPARASHCAQCNMCISHLDHHCKWLNNCVGERNYRFFISLLIGIVTSCVWLTALCFVHIFSRNSLHDTPMSLFLIIYCLLGMAFPGLLLFYHSVMAVTGITTREYFQIDKGSNLFAFLRNIASEPFNTHSAWKNLAVQWCKPRGSATVQNRGAYQSGDTRFENIQFGTLL